MQQSKLVLSLLSIATVAQGPGTATSSGRACARAALFCVQALLRRCGSWQCACIQRIRHQRRGRSLQRTPGRRHATRCLVLLQISVPLARSTDRRGRWRAVAAHAGGVPALLDRVKGGVRYAGAHSCGGLSLRVYAPLSQRSTVCGCRGLQAAGLAAAAPVC